MVDPEVRVVSLFAGIGGLDLGVERAVRRLGFRGCRSVYVEREAFAAAALVAAMERDELAPGLVWAGDVESFPAERFHGVVDVVLAGFPCPPVSCAGKRRGTDDVRWLWPEVVRVVEKTGADALFAENVPGLFTANEGDAFREVLDDLAKIGLDAEWATFTASEVGAPHRRERIFLLAHREHAGLLGRRAPHDGPREADAHWNDADGRDPGVADARRLRDDAHESVAIAGSGGPAGARGDGSALADAESPDRGTDASGRGERHRRLPGRVEAPGRSATGGTPVVDATCFPEREPDDTARTDARRDARPDAGGRRDELADSCRDGRERTECRPDEAQQDFRRGGELEDARGSCRGPRPLGQRVREVGGVVADASSGGLGEPGSACGDRLGTGEHLDVVADADVGQQQEERACDEPRGRFASWGGGATLASGTRATGRAVVAHADGVSRVQEPRQQRRERAHLARGGRAWPCRFPPGPNDRERWRGILIDDEGLSPATEPRVRGMADGLPARVDRLRALGNAVLPDDAELAFLELLARFE